MLFRSLAVEGSESSQDTFTDSSDGDGANDLVFEVVLISSNGGNVPLLVLDLPVSWNEVADKDQDCHDDVFSDRNDIGAGDFGNGDTAVGLVGGIEVDMIGTNSSCDGNLQLLGLLQALLGKVAWVESEVVLM